MGKFIEEFYYGTIDPQARSTKQNKAVQKQMEALMLNEEFLTEEQKAENSKNVLEDYDLKEHFYRICCAKVAQCTKPRERYNKQRTCTASSHSAAFDGYSL